MLWSAAESNKHDGAALASELLEAGVAVAVYDRCPPAGEELKWQHALRIEGGGGDGGAQGGELPLLVMLRVACPLR